MKGRTLQAACVAVLSGALFLAACRRAPQPDPTQFVSTVVKTAVETSEVAATPVAERKPSATVKAATVEAAPQITPTDTVAMDPAPVEAYPAPVEAYPGPAPTYDVGGTSYPAPAQGSSAGAYPGSSANPTPNPYPASGGQAPTQQPAATPTSGSTTPASGSTTPTPRPSAATPAGSATVAPSPTLAGTPTPVPATATPTQSPTPTGPRPTLNVELLATDPRTVQLASGKVQFVEFFTFWCGICKAMAPVVNELEADYEDQVKFIYLDTDDPANSAFERKLSFRKEPHFFLLDGQGKILKQWQGYVSTDDFREALNFVLQ